MSSFSLSPFSPDGRRFRSRKEIARYLEKQGKAVDVGLFDFRRVDFTRDPCKRKEHSTRVPEKKGKRIRPLQSAVTVVVNDKVSKQTVQNTFMVTIPIQQPHGVVQLPVIVTGAAEPGTNNCNNNNGLKLLTTPPPLSTTTSNNVMPDTCTKSPTSLGNIVQKLWERQLKKPEDVVKKPPAHLPTPQASHNVKKNSNTSLDVQRTVGIAQNVSTVSSQSSSAMTRHPPTMPRLQTPMSTAIGGLCMPALKPSSACVSTPAQTAPIPTSCPQQQLVSVPTLNGCNPRPVPLPLPGSSRAVPTSMDTTQPQSPVLFKPLLQPLSPQNGHNMLPSGTPFPLPFRPAFMNYMVMPKSPAAVPILMTPPATPTLLNNFVSFATPSQLSTLPFNFKSSLSRAPL